MIKLTKRQKEILHWIVSYTQSYLRPPVIQEVADEFKIKHSSAYDIIKALQKKGYLEKSEGISRSIFPTDLYRANKELMDKDLVRLIKTSSSIAEDVGYDGFIRVPYNMTRGQYIFTVTVVDDSMKDAAMKPGDLAIIREQNHADDHDIIITGYKKEAMIRYFYHDYDSEEKDEIILAPANDNYPTIKTKRRNMKIYGTVIALYRNISL